ncbi:hypothetical protein EBR21_17960 [bacterium]|nr:hypothetical protein [bacterium]
MFSKVVLLFSLLIALSCEKKANPTNTGANSSESKVGETAPASREAEASPAAGSSSGSATSSAPASGPTPLPSPATDLSYAKVMAARILPGDGCTASPSSADNSARKEDCWADLRLDEKNYRYHFYVTSSADWNALRFSGQCAGMDFPSNTWPSGCELSFSGPRINEAQRSVALPKKGPSITCNSDGCPMPIKLIEYDILKGDLDRCYLTNRPCFADLEILGVKKRFHFSKEAYINGNEDVLRMSQGCDVRNIVRLPTFADCSLAFQGPSIIEHCGEKWSDALSCNQSGCRCRSIDLGPGILL